MAALNTTPSSIRWTIRSKSDVQESDFGGRVVLIPRSPETEEAILAGARSKIDLWKKSRRPPSPTPQSKDDGDEDNHTHFPSGGPDYMTLERNLPKHPVVLVQKLSKGHNFYCGSSHVNHITIASPGKAESCYINLRHFYFRQPLDDLNCYVDLVNLSTSEFSFTIDGHQTKIGTGGIQRLYEGKQEATLGNGLEFYIVVASKSQSTSSSPTSEGPLELQHRERIEDGPERSSKPPETLVEIRKEHCSSKAKAKKHRRSNTDTNINSKEPSKSSPITSPQAKRARQAGGDDVVIYSSSASRVVCIEEGTTLLAVKQVTGKDRHRNWKTEIDILVMMNHENIIQLINTDRHRLTITTLYVGPDLSKYVKSDTQPFSVFSIAEACVYWKQLAKGLAYVHSKGFAHFDLKPQNVLLNASVAKICDFGLAKRVEINTSVPYPGGTVPYLPPEYLKFKKGSFPSDVWALGGTMLFLLGIIPLPKIKIDFKSIGKDTAATEKLDQWQTQLTNHAASHEHHGIRRLLLLHLSKDPAERITASSLTTENWEALPLPTPDHI